jgi:uncharacterized protein
MPVVIAFCMLIAFMGTMYPQRDTPKGELRLSPLAERMALIQLRENVKPYKEEFQFKNIVKQELDYSCGSAALTTLLNYYFGEKMSEEQVIQGLMHYGDAEKIQERRAFSLLDMKRFVEVLGYKATGYKAELGDLKALNKPVIIPIELSGYKHFVIFRGIYGNHIYVADPFRGNTSFPIETFNKIWSQNIVLVVSSDTGTINALRLTDKDLQVIDFDVVKDAVPPTFPPLIVTEQRQFFESLGSVRFKTVNAR